MFLIRQARTTDLDDLQRLARQVHFINLPPDRAIIEAKIRRSADSFARLAGNRAGTGAQGGALPRGSGIAAITSRSDLFMFVLEDTESGSVIGTSQVIARMGGKGEPRVFLQLSERSQWSDSLKLGWTHTHAELGQDESGPTEVGGLILNPFFRRHKARLGRLLSLVRFHLIGLHPRRFAPRVVAEMLGPITPEGYNPFWERCTRHFIPRSFDEANRLSQQTREFIIALMPRHGIDLTILDPEAALRTGDVAEDTRPARRILEKLGFRYHHRIDPFDGGPHLEARTRDIAPVRATRAGKRLAEDKGGRAARARRAEPDHLVSTLDEDGNFRAVQAVARLEGSGMIALRRDALAVLSPAPGKSTLCVGLTPLAAAEGDAPVAPTPPRTAH